MSCLSCCGDTLVSGSWDHTARVWATADATSSSFDCTLLLKGHQGPLWAVTQLPSGDVLTASADHTILQWQHGKVRTLFVIGSQDLNWQVKKKLIVRSKNYLFPSKCWSTTRLSTGSQSTLKQRYFTKIHKIIN